MQERRTNIRYDHTDRAQYCPANDLLPRDGRITNVSERGIGLLVQEPHQLGERVTVSFSLDNENEPMTATGVARWSATEPVHGRWFSLGVEWLPFEDATRTRMRAYLQERRQRPAPAAEARRSSSPSGQGEGALDRMLIRAGTVVGLTASVVLALWARQLHQQTQQLAVMVQDRNVTIDQMHNQTLELQGELQRAQAGLAMTAEEVARLDKQNQYFAEAMDRLNSSMDSIRIEYSRLREDYASLTLERTELSRQLYLSEQQRMELARRMTSLPDLRQAMRDLNASARGGQSRAVGVSPSASDTRPAQAEAPSPGASASGTGWIRVYDPQVVSNSSNQLGP